MYKYFFHSVISIHNYIYGESVLFFFLYTGVLSWKQLGYSLLFHLAFYLTWYYKHFFIQPQSSLLLLHFPSPGNLPNPAIEHRSPALQADSLLSEPPGKLHTTSWVALQCIKGKYYNFIKLFPYHLAYMHPKIFLKRNYKASGSVTSASFSQPY